APTGGRVDAKTESVVSDGVFYAVLKGIPRPFREPGMSILQFLGSGEKERESWKQEVGRLPLFDHNPEVLRIESATQTGSSVLNVVAKSEIKDVTGIVHFAYNRYSVLVDPAS